jgi:predicted neutral ceramidase superfamily lipid hydrolase
MPAFSDLQTNLASWLILAAVASVWIFSVRLVPGWASESWLSLLKSLYGFVWLGFGLDVSETSKSHLLTLTITDNLTMLRASLIGRRW